MVRLVGALLASDVWVEHNYRMIRDFFQHTNLGKESLGDLSKPETNLGMPKA